MYSCPPISPGFASAVSTNWEMNTVFSICGSESVDAKGQLYALFYPILCKELECLWILVTTGDPGSNTPWIVKNN